MRMFWTVLFLLVPVFGVGAFIAGAIADGGWLPRGISSYSQSIDSLFYIILGITGFFFVVTELLLAYAIFTGRGPAEGKSHFSHGNKNLEVGWTVMTAAILLFVAFTQIPVWSRAKFISNKPKKTPDAMVTASQFLWQIRYPMWDEQANKPKTLNSLNPSLQESFELINELHVSETDADKGEQTLIHLSTRDVIHSFWLPNVRVKQDALPGHMIPVWFDAKRPGIYEWVCAELCGWGHYRMRARLIVHPREGPDSYNEWLKKESKRQVAVAAAE
jgi:cytochrome c oxidase subunit 2